MPELPEVETTLRGIQPHLLNQRIRSILVSQPKLRWPVPDEIQQLTGARIQSLQRRAKYLLIDSGRGHLIWHLGMSGSLRIQPVSAKPEKHEHVRIDFDNGTSLRYRDPRRFGAVLLTHDDPLQHPLIAELGPEPLATDFDARYLHQQCSGKKSSIKSVIMDSHVVVGIGNIYACESLFLSGINPRTRAGRISERRLARLVDTIKAVLAKAIEQGGTTLQDFTQADGKPGYFRQHLNVYGKNGPCPSCGQAIRRITQSQRSTFYCSHCQK